MAVNVMTASVLRGVVETALSDLLAFFRIHGTPFLVNRCSDNHDDMQSSSRPKRSGGGGAGGDGETRREHGFLHGKAWRGEQEQEGEEEEKEEWLLRGCPPLFKVPARQLTALIFF